MIPQTREDFKEFCLRALGKGVLEINVSNEQVEDRVDEALYLYQQFHMDAVVKQYLKHQITASTMVLNPVTGTFVAGEGLRIGSEQIARGIVHEVVNANTLSHYTTAGLPFANGDVVTGSTSSASGTITSLTLGDMDNGFFPVVDNGIVAVTRMLGPFDNRLGVGDILFDPQAQFNMSLIANFTNTSLIPYVMGRTYQQLMNDVLRGRPMIRFQRHQNRIYVDELMRRSFMPEQYIIVEAYQAIDPETYADVWADEWLQRYTTALLKRQWGQNLSKYQGIALPGGITLDGKAMWTEANEEVQRLRDELKTTFQLPIDFFVG